MSSAPCSRRVTPPTSGVALLLLRGAGRAGPQRGWRVALQQLHHSDCERAPTAPVARRARIRVLEAGRGGAAPRGTFRSGVRSPLCVCGSRREDRRLWWRCVVGGSGAAALGLGPPPGRLGEDDGRVGTSAHGAILWPSVCTDGRRGSCG